MCRPRSCLLLTVVLELDHESIDDLDPPRSFRKADTVARRRKPLADGLETAMIVMTGHVVEYSRVVDERVQFSERRQQTFPRLVSNSLQPQRAWRFGLAVTLWHRSTKLIYAGPGYYLDG